MRGLLDRWTSDDLVIAVMDVRGDTAGEVPEAYLGGHASTSAQARQLAEAIAEELSWRLDPALRPTGDTEGPSSRVDAAPGSDPRIVVVVDDFDILGSGGTEPLAPLLEFLPSARDLKLHVLLTRLVAGSGRALYERSVQTLHPRAVSCGSSTSASSVVAMDERRNRGRSRNERLCVRPATVGGVWSRRTTVGLCAPHDGGPRGGSRQRDLTGWHGAPSRFG